MTVESSEHWLHLRNVRIPRQGEWKHRAEDWCLLSLRRGKGTLQDGNRSYRLRVGEIALLPAGTEGSVRADPDSEASIGCLVLPAESMEGGLSLGVRLVFRRASNVSRGATILSATSALSRRAKDLLQHTSPSGHYDLNPPHDLNGITPLLEELTEFLVEFRRSTGGTPGRMFTVLRSIDDSVLQGLSVNELAKRCGCSRRHLSRLVREHCDCSLASIRLELRLDKAAKILRMTNNKIIDVALDCGFNHLGSFTAKFRRRFGATPGKWRKGLADALTSADPLPIWRSNHNGVNALRAQSR